MNLIKRLKVEISRIDTKIKSGEQNEFYLIRQAEICKILLMTRKAIECYKILSEMYPENNLYIMSLGELYAHIGDYDRGIECYQHLIDNGTKSASVFMAMGDVYRAMGEYYIAIEYYRKAREIYKQKFRNVITFESKIFDPSYTAINEIESILENVKIPDMKITEILAEHITKPFLYELTLLREELQHRISNLLPLKIDLNESLSQDAEHKYKYALGSYLSYIEEYPLDTYALETVARIVYALNIDDLDVNIFWKRILGIYRDMGYHVGEKVEETRHNIQVALRMEDLSRISSDIEFLSKWNPRDPLLSIAFKKGYIPKEKVPIR